MKWPRVVAIPLSVVLGWVALSLFSRAATLRLEGKGLRGHGAATTHPNPQKLATRDMFCSKSACEPAEARLAARKDLHSTQSGCQ